MIATVRQVAEPTFLAVVPASHAGGRVGKEGPGRIRGTGKVVAETADCVVHGSGIVAGSLIVTGGRAFGGRANIGTVEEELVRDPPVDFELKTPIVPPFFVPVHQLVPESLIIE